MSRFFLTLLFCTFALSAQMLVQHDYDPVSDTVVSWQIAPGSSAGQSMHLQAGSKVGGFRVKLRRLGEPLPLEYRLGKSAGAADLASGVITMSQVNPWFELWQEVRFKVPIIFHGKEDLYLQLRLPRDSSGAYEWYGTATAELKRPEFQTRFQYSDNFYPKAQQAREFENPTNIDYGFRTSSYDDGAAFDGAGAKIQEMDFAFAIEGAQMIKSPGEERFSFINEITGPLYTHSLRRSLNRVATSEVAINSSWQLKNETQSVMVKIAANELLDFMRVAMETRLGRNGTKRISVDVGCGMPPKKAEGFELEVRSDSIKICGYDERGAMRGLHYLEAQMKMRRGPYLRIGENKRAPLLSPRITSAPFYSKVELDTPVDQYTDGLLGRMARAGFNAIWVWGDLDEVSHSDVYPELDNGAAARQARLNHLISRAARYGIDVYLYLASRPLPEEFFSHHPEVRGSALPAYGGVNVLCTSAPEVRKHFRSATGNLMKGVPSLKGVMFIVGGEGFIHCYTRKNTCSRCSRRSPQETIAEFSAAVFEGVRSSSSSAAVAIWPYSASNTWSKGDTTQSQLIAKLPPGMTWLTEFGKEGDVAFGGIKIPAYDYPISIVGPSDRFVKQSVLTHERGLGLWAKTEHAIALEFIQAPYIPVFFQWAERFRRVNSSPGLSGEFANWMHYGFMPTRAADLFYWNIWDQPQDAEEILKRIAVRDFGEAASSYVVDAWGLFSKAMREYPFSSAMAMGPVQSGPAHPLFFDVNYKPAHGVGRQFKNDLSWTKPWGPRLAVSQMEKMETLWASGVEKLREAERMANAEDRPEIHRELGVASAVLACIRSTIHVGRFYMLRDQLLTAKDKTKATEILESMTQVAEAEIRNAKEVLPYVQADSRLGYANSGKNDQAGVPRAGIYSPVSIEKKIVQVEKMLREDIPSYRRTKGLN